MQVFFYFFFRIICIANLIFLTDLCFGKAIMTSPKTGLDAFCQKLLVYEDDKGEVWVAFNDIVAFANLYYGTATKPQQMINQRLIAAFSKAVKKAV